MGQAKQRGTFEERKQAAQRRDEGKAQWLAQQQQFSRSNTANTSISSRVRPKGGSLSRTAIMGAALAATMGTTIKKD